MALQWLRLHTSTAGDVGSIPGQGTKISHERKIKAAQVVGDAEPDGLFGAKLMWIMIPVASWGAESAPYMISVHHGPQIPGPPITC